MNTYTLHELNNQKNILLDDINKIVKRDIQVSMGEIIRILSNAFNILDGLYYEMQIESFKIQINIKDLHKKLEDEIDKEIRFKNDDKIMPFTIRVEYILKKMLEKNLYDPNANIPSIMIDSFNKIAHIVMSEIASTIFDIVMSGKFHFYRFSILIEQIEKEINLSDTKTYPSKNKPNKKIDSSHTNHQLDLEAIKGEAHVLKCVFEKRILKCTLFKKIDADIKNIKSFDFWDLDTFIFKVVLDKIYNGVISEHNQLKPEIRKLIEMHFISNIIKCDFLNDSTLSLIEKNKLYNEQVDLHNDNISELEISYWNVFEERKFRFDEAFKLTIKVSESEAKLYKINIDKNGAKTIIWNDQKHIIQ